MQNYWSASARCLVREAPCWTLWVGRCSPSSSTRPMRAPRSSIPARHSSTARIFQQWRVPCSSTSRGIPARLARRPYPPGEVVPVSAPRSGRIRGPTRSRGAETRLLCLCRVEVFLCLSQSNESITSNKINVSVRPVSCYMRSIN